MKLVIITQEIDEEGDLLGFFPAWVREFSHHFGSVDVVYFRGKGAKMPVNVKLHEVGGNKAEKAWKINRLISKIRPDAIFTHMCPEFVISLFPSAGMYEIPIVMFHAHGAVTPELELAEKIAKKVITTTDSGFRVPSKKKVVLHQGIRTEDFYKREGRYILDVARLSEVKHHDLIIEAFAKICNRYKKVNLVIVGEDPSEKKETKKKLAELVIARGVSDRVEFLGKVPHREMPSVYSECLFFVSASETGSLDKTGLEAMASSKPILVCNEAFNELLKGEEKFCIFKKSNILHLAAKMENMLDNPGEAEELGEALQGRVMDKHHLKDLIERMSEEIKAVVNDG